MDANKLKVGRAAWFIPDGYLLAVKSKIIEVDTQWKDKHPDGIVFYDIDEPVGHSVNADELLTKREARAQLLFLYENKCYKYEDGPAVELDLYRKNRIKFIVSTWNLQKWAVKWEIDKWYNSLPPKEYGVEWFNLQYIHSLDKKVNQ
jgi:hypothetical protein